MPLRRSRGIRRSTARKVVSCLAIVLAFVLVGGTLTVYLKYRQVWDSIDRIDVSADLRGTRPPVDPNAINLLLIGSDSRSGENGAIGGSAGISGARSDTDMLVHIAPGDRQVVVLSFPRDSVVPILQCAPEDGTVGQTAEPGEIEQLNATFAYGGPGCLWETLEQTTGIHIDDFVELTFVGFEEAINALGGVDVCLPAAVDDPMSGLDISAGFHHIFGAQALAFWRTREDLGMGSDPQRIQRDQYLMAALLQGIERTGLADSPTKLLGVVDALSAEHGNVTTDSQLTPGRMLQIADDLRGLSAESVQFVTVPWVQYPPNPNWVQWAQPDAGNLFAAIAHDTSLPEIAARPRPKEGRNGKRGKTGKKATQQAVPPTTTAQSTTTVQPSQVQVTVFNGSGVAGIATSTSAALSQRGFDVVGPPQDAATDTYAQSVIEYDSAAELPAAQLLAQQVGTAANVQLQLDPQLGSTVMDLVLGSTFTALEPVTGNAGIQNLAETYGGITGNVDICDDQSAFAGPDGD
jgi:LCP family protein required for cell wall assembly